MNYFSDSAEIIKSLEKQHREIEKITSFIKKRLKKRNKILIAGNGGSSADAQHFAGELICTYKSKNRSSYPAISLMDNTSALSAWGNDFDFTGYVERQLSAIADKNDILFLLSTSGGNLKKKQSINLIKAANYAKKNKITVISLIGANGGELEKLSDMYIKIDSNKTSHIQEAHIAIIHYICEALEY